MGRLARLAATLKQKYREEKASLEGKAISRARMVMNAKDIPQISHSLRAETHETGAPKPIPGANVRMYDRRPMTFFTDGSLRSSFGPRPDMSGRQLKKLRKKIRRAKKDASPKKKLVMRVLTDGEA